MVYTYNVRTARCRYGCDVRVPDAHNWLVYNYKMELLGRTPVGVTFGKLICAYYDVFVYLCAGA